MVYLFIFMYSSIETIRVKDFTNHFIKPKIEDIPNPGYKIHPTGITIPPELWRCCREFPNIYIVNDDYKYFYCYHCECNDWYALSGTFGNIKKHIKYDK